MTHVTHDPGLTSYDCCLSSAHLQTRLLVRPILAVTDLSMIFVVIEIPGQNLIFCAGATGVQTIGNNHNYCLSSAHQLQHKILTRYFNYNKIRLRWVTASIRLTNKRVTRVNVTKIITVKSRTFLGLMPKGG